mmetsp:Transcript_66706/g.217129  ORF Transcript_66706/g.217129 Transcript_66706/m.217129 type:complete len:244 (+) Transcript_66706:600-1331(+)
MLGKMAHSNEMPSGEDPLGLTQSEEAVLREVFDAAVAKSAGSDASISDLLRACQACQGVTVLFGSRQRLRRMALEAVTQGVVGGIVRMIGGTDGVITLAELADFAVNADAQGLSLAEEMWFQELFKGCHESGFDGDFLAREGESITKAYLAEHCRERPHNALLFGLKRRLHQKTLEEATRDALVSIFGAADLHGRDVRGERAERVGWEVVRDLFEKAMTEAASEPPATQPADTAAGGGDAVAA